MYKPLFNKVLVEIDDKDAKWGNGSDDSIAGEVYREGKVVSVGLMIPTADYPLPETQAEQALTENTALDLINKQIMWHEGHEAGTVFEENDKKYALIYWWDIIGVKE